MASATVKVSPPVKVEITPAPPETLSDRPGTPLDTPKNKKSSLQTTPTMVRKSSANSLTGKRPSTPKSPKARTQSPAPAPPTPTRPKTAPVPPLPLNPDYDWSREQLLGKGRCTNCHEVVKVPRVADGKFVAIRKIASPICRSVDVSDALNEVTRLTKLPNHENLITFRTCSGVDKAFKLEVHLQPFLEVEYFREGSLNARIQKHFASRGAFTHRQILRYMHQLTLGVAFLHSHGILHRDIRPKNIFIVENDVLKLGDVGCPKVFQNRSHASRYPGAFWTAINRLNAGPHHCCLSPPNSWPYMPIEIMCEFRFPSKKDIHITEPDRYVAASDIWSMGVVLFELLCLKVPFPGRTPKAVQKMIGNQMPLAQLIVPAVRDYPNELRLLPRRLLCIEPAERIKEGELEKILRHQIHKYDMFKAVKDGDLATVQRLVQQEKVDVNMVDAADYTPLMWAAEHGHQPIVDFLMKNGANPAARNKFGWTAHDWAHNQEVMATLNRGAS